MKKKKKQNIKRKDLMKTILFGVAVGDALGLPVQFKDRETVLKDPICDMRGYDTFDMPCGTWSDDTSLTLCLADSLINGFDINDIADKFKKWMFEGYLTPFDRAFDIGHTTLYAVNNLQNGIKPELSGLIDEYSNGNGSLMRILPLVPYIIDMDIDQRYDHVKKVSSITHRHIRSIISCFYYTEFAKCIIEGKNLKDIYVFLQDHISEYLNKIKVPQKEISMLERLLKGRIYELNVDDIDSSGYVIHTLEASIWSLMNTDNYKRSVLKAVNLGEDTDTTGAVTGGLSALFYGYDDIPSEWINTLIRKEMIMDLIDKN